MMRSSQPHFLPQAILLVCFVGALFAIHATVASLTGREIADFSVLIAFFVMLLWLVNR